MRDFSSKQMPPPGVRPIRLLQIVDSLEQGGMENILVQVCNHLDPKDCAITVACLSRSGPLAERLREGVDVVCLDKPPGFSITAANQLRSLIQRGGFDLIHTHHLGGLMYTTIAQALARLARLPPDTLAHTGQGARHRAGHAEEHLSLATMMERSPFSTPVPCSDPPATRATPHHRPPPPWSSVSGPGGLKVSATKSWTRQRFFIDGAAVGVVIPLIP